MVSDMHSSRKGKMFRSFIALPEVPAPLYMHPCGDPFAAPRAYRRRQEQLRDARMYDDYLREKEQKRQARRLHKRRQEERMYREMLEEEELRRQVRHQEMRARAQLAAEQQARRQAARDRALHARCLAEQRAREQQQRLHRRSIYDLFSNWFDVGDAPHGQVHDVANHNVSGGHRAQRGVPRQCIEDERAHDEEAESSDSDTVGDTDTSAEESTMVTTDSDDDMDVTPPCDDVMPLDAAVAATSDMVTRDTIVVDQDATRVVHASFKSTSNDGIKFIIKTSGIDRLRPDVVIEGDVLNVKLYGGASPNDGDARNEVLLAKRAFSLQGRNSDTISAKLENGTLVVRIPQEQAPKRRNGRRFITVQEAPLLPLTDEEVRDAAESAEWAESASNSDADAVESMDGAWDEASDAGYEDGVVEELDDE